MPSEGNGHTLEFAFNREVDPQELLDLLTEVGFDRLGERSQQDLPDMLRQTDRYVTCHLGAAIVGLVRLLTDYHTIGYVCDLCVAPAHRHQGIGTRLMQMIVEDCDEKRIPVVHLLDTSDYDAFYDQFGFVSEKAIIGLYRLAPFLLADTEPRSGT